MEGEDQGKKKVKKEAEKKEKEETCRQEGREGIARPQHAVCPHLFPFPITQVCY